MLDVTAAAGFGTAGMVTGTVHANDAAIEFLGGGQISTVSAGSELHLDGNNAFVEDSKSLGSNSALTGLVNVAGEFRLDEGASVSTTGALVDSGLIGLDYYDSSQNKGGSTLSIAGGLTNSGVLGIGNTILSSSDHVTAKSFVNSGTVALIGNKAALAALDVSGSTTNNGSISITTDTETLAGSVNGAGSFSLSNASLLFGSSVSSGQTINEIGVDRLRLKQVESFGGTISGFGTGDTIDAMNLLFSSGPIATFAENSAGTGGTLTLQDGNTTANILMTGHYTTGNFTLAADSGTGHAGGVRWTPS
jgi:hypothetical protein